VTLREAKERALWCHLAAVAASFLLTFGVALELYLIQARAVVDLAASSAANFFREELEDREESLRTLRDELAEGALPSGSGAPVAGVSSLLRVSPEGRILRTYAGPLLGRIRLPSAFRADRWAFAEALSPAGLPALVRSLPLGKDRLVAAWPPEEILGGFSLPSVEGIWFVLTDEEGTVLASEGDRSLLPPGSPAPRSLVAVDGRTWTFLGGWGLYGESRSVTGGIRLSGGLFLVDLARSALCWGLLLGGLSALMGAIARVLLGRTLERVSDDVEAISGTLREIARGIGGQDSPTRALAALEGRIALAVNRAQEAHYQETRDLTESFLELISTIGAQGEELAALYAEAEAMQGDLEENNFRLKRAVSQLEELGLLTQTATRAPSARSAAAEVVSALRDHTGARCVALARRLEGNVDLLGFAGGRDLADSFRGDLRALWAERGAASDIPSRGVLAGMSFHRYPIDFLGETLGAIYLLDPPGGEENLQGDLSYVLDLFVPYLGGVLRANLLVDEVKRSYQYFALRLEGIAGAFHEETGNHLKRIGAYSRLLAEAVGLEEDRVEEITLHAQLHDLGKIRIPLEILNKPGPLTEEEFRVIRRHAEYGESLIGDAAWLASARAICRSHHERWDGTGYPDGLSGESIPLEARIVALADVYDALRSARCYKPAFSRERTYRILTEGDGRVRPAHFDPRILAIFRDRHEEFDRIWREDPD